MKEMSPYFRSCLIQHPAFFELDDVEEMESELEFLSVNMEFGSFTFRELVRFTIVKQLCFTIRELVEVD